MSLLIAIAAVSAFPELARCGSEPLLCQSRPRLSARAVDALLRDRPSAWWVLGDRLTVVARRDQPVMICCAIQTALHPIGHGLQAAVIRVPDIESAIFDIRILPSAALADAPVWRGPAAPPAPEMSEGQSRNFRIHSVESRHLGQRRRIYVHVPDGASPTDPLPVIYLADALPASFAAIAQARAERNSGARLILVGIESAPTTTDPDCAPRCDPRSREYLIDIPGATQEESRFDAHARFVAEEVIPFVEARFPVMRSREGRATAGFSSGGAWAVTMAARHPELFGNVIGLSVGWRPAAEAAGRLGRTRLFLGAGRLEPRFLERTTLAAQNARAAGAEVRLVTPNAGHGHANWDILFADAIAWLFPPAPRMP